MNALLFAIPAICNVLMVCAIFWLLFAIGGYQFFGGRFRKCVDADGARLAHTLVPDKHTCLEFQANGTGYSWVNSKINFDNVWAGYLALLQVVIIHYLCDQLCLCSKNYLHSNNHHTIVISRLYIHTCSLQLKVIYSPLTKI